MKYKALVVGVSLAIASTFALAAPTAVTVNGKTISVQEQEKIIKQFVKSGQKRTPELEMQIRNELILQEVILQEANRLKLAQRPDVKDAIENSRKAVLMRALSAELAKKNPVKDADVKKFYDDQKKAYGDREYKISLITVKTDADAKKVVEDLKDGDKFDKVAKKYSLDESTKGNGGKIDKWTSVISLPQMIGYAIRSTEKGKFTEVPIQSNGVFYIIKVDDSRKTELFPSYEKSKEYYRNLLVQAKVNANIQELRQKAEVKIGNK